MSKFYVEVCVAAVPGELAGRFGFQKPIAASFVGQPAISREEADNWESAKARQADIRINGYTGSYANGDGKMHVFWPASSIIYVAVSEEK